MVILMRSRQCSSSRTMLRQLYSFLSLCWVHVLAIQPDLSVNRDIICSRNKDTSLMLNSYPPLPKVFEAHIKVTDHIRNQTFQVIEYSNMEQTALHRFDSGNTTICKYRHQEREGHIIEGVRCNWTDVGPSRCFCSANSPCVSFVSMFAIFGYMRDFGLTPLTEVKDLNHSSKTTGNSHWQLVCSNSQSVNSTLNVITSFMQDGDLSPWGEENAPYFISIQARGDILDVHQNEMDLTYEVTQFHRSVKDKEVFLPPPGVYCSQPRSSRTLPELADVFSLTMETILPDKQVISYTHHTYDSVEKMVAFTVPNFKHSPLNLGIAAQSFMQQKEGSRFIHDFDAGVQYLIDQYYMNCSVTAIPRTAFDAVLIDNNHIRLRHANELLKLNGQNFVYVGERQIRGIPCDVWISEKPFTDRGEYVTLEVYFIQDNWMVEAESFNHEKMAPVAVVTYVAKSESSQNFSDVIRTYFFDYKVGFPDWTQFDISQCLARTNRLFLRFILKVAYADLIQPRISVVQDSLRRMIAQLTGVSLLRISNVFLSASKSQEVMVWFVLLEQANVTGSDIYPKTQLTLHDAHISLLNVIEKEDVEINLSLGPRKKMNIFIKKASLEMTYEYVHSTALHSEIRLVKAGFSTGSMVGLGFSMAILGGFFGLLVGFLLWKRGTGIPYFVHD